MQFPKFIMCLKYTPYTGKRCSTWDMQMTVCFHTALDFNHDFVYYSWAILLWKWPHFLISESNQYSLRKAMEILFVASALKYWLEGVDRKMLSTVSLKTNSNWVIDLDSSKQRTSSVSWLIWECCHLIDVVWGFFFCPRWCPKLLPKQLHWSRGSAPAQGEPHVCLGRCAALQQCQWGQCDPGGGVERLCAAWHTWGVCRVCISVSSQRIWNPDFGHRYVEALTCLLAISVWRRSCRQVCQRKILTDWLSFGHFEYFKCCLT